MKALDRKSKPRYLGPYKVMRRSRGGAYVLQELDGTEWRSKIAASRVMPYISRGDPRLRYLADDLEAMTDDEESSSFESDAESTSDEED